MVRCLPFQETTLDSHACGTSLAAVDLRQRVRVLLAQRVKLETLATVIELQARIAGVVDIGDVAGDGIGLVSVQSLATFMSVSMARNGTVEMAHSRVAWWVRVLGMEVTQGAIEAIGRWTRPGVYNELLRLSSAVLTRQDRGAAGRAEEECGGSAEQHLCCGIGECSA